MFTIILYQPEIPPNTGNIIRLCANTGCQLHLIEPLGFTLDDKKLRRAGLDYHEWAQLTTHADITGFDLRNSYALSTKAQRCYTEASFNRGDTLIFGPETRGLPASLLAQLPAENRLRLPMLANSRSLNLSNTVAIVVYEALRQQRFSGLI